jgi:diguanylate cyclase (GGDEF)-like protein
MIFIAAACYLISFVCQFAAAMLSLKIIKSTPSAFKWAWISLSFGLMLMLGRRVSPLAKLFELGIFNFSDALLSVPISGLLLLGIYGIRKLLMQEKNNSDLLATLSQFDALTNSLSKSEILFRVTEEIERSRRSGHSFSLIEMDIDHFKVVNDTYGHQAGDEILINLIRRSKEVLRSIDFIGRIGGEEFLILLPETNLEGALQTAERLRSHIDSTIYQTNETTVIHITISLGVSIFDPKIHLREDKNFILAEILRKADVAMYQAKNLGRNRVQLWDSDCSFVPVIKQDA